MGRTPSASLPENAVIEAPARRDQRLGRDAARDARTPIPSRSTMTTSAPAQRQPAPLRSPPAPATENRNARHTSIVPVVPQQFRVVAVYAAYGSNLDPAQMHDLCCPLSLPSVLGWLEGWRLTFGGEPRPARAHARDRSCRGARLPCLRDALRHRDARRDDARRDRVRLHRSLREDPAAATPTRISGVPDARRATRRWPAPPR